MIEWTDVTWNPIRGCSRVSEGCRNCYAERMAARFAKPGAPFHGFAEMAHQHLDTSKGTYRRFGGRPRWTGRVELIPEKLGEPLRWRKPRRVFVNSMSDLFHEALPDEAIDQVFATMIKAQRHTFQVLTKRPERMRSWVSSRGFHPAQVGHVWLGVSCEDQATADERVPLLLQTPAAVRFVSYEPALGPVDFRWGGMALPDYAPHRPLPMLDWLIVGGESGPGARPCDVAWVRSIRDQCREASVPCFIKQLGARPADDSARWQDWRGIGRGRATMHSGRMWVALDHPKGGDPAEWPEDLRVREFPR